jgi:hypothetical protein
MEINIHNSFVGDNVHIKKPVYKVLKEKPKSKKIPKKPNYKQKTWAEKFLSWEISEQRD